MLPAALAIASIRHYFARKQVGDTQKRGKPEMRSSCRNSLNLHCSALARLSRGCASVPHLRYLSVSRHFNEKTPFEKECEVVHFHLFSSFFFLSFFFLLEKRTFLEHDNVYEWCCMVFYLVGEERQSDLRGAEVTRVSVCEQNMKWCGEREREREVGGGGSRKREREKEKDRERDKREKWVTARQWFNFF